LGSTTGQRVNNLPLNTANVIDPQERIRQRAAEKQLVPVETVLV
jgi:hypothetical protein